MKSVKVAILTPCFLPGYKAGGPIQTVKNICEAYKDKSDIYVVTLNHDEDENETYQNIQTAVWIVWEGVHIMYLEDKDFNWRFFKKIYEEFDTIYSCGLFSKNTYLIMMVNRLYSCRKKRLYVAPMGVFSERAFASK